MNNILNFEQFVNESYLKGSRQPIYHFTFALNDILKSDMLKTSRAADGEKSISFTRSVYYEDYASSGVRLVLDADKLKNDGYKIIPYDEVGRKISHRKEDRFKGYGKANYKFVMKSVIHKLNIPEWQDEDGLDALEWEYEERSFKDIKNLGKYLIAIDISDNSLYDSREEIIREYLKKYPHIKIFDLNIDKLWDRSKEITSEIMGEPMTNQ